jgi:peptide/nickel transport system substrate-binding protein
MSVSITIRTGLLAIAFTTTVSLAADPVDINPPSLSQPPPADLSQVAIGETLYCCLRGSPGTLNPILMSSASDERLKELLFDYPFAFNNRLEWVINPSIADSFVDAPDHLSSTLRLKEGLLWHDGKSFTAEDIAYSWRKIVDDRVPAVGARSGPDQLSECIVLDNRTIKFVYKNALPTNKWHILFAIVPKHVYAKHETDDPTLSSTSYYDKANRNPIGNGPYKFVKWITDDRIELERWEDYPGPKPYFKRIVIRIITDAQARLLAFEKQQIDEIELTPKQFTRDTTGPLFKKVGVKGKASQWKYSYIGWNMDGSNPFFTDRRVRRAMGHAINYDRIIRQLYQGLFTRSHGIFHPDAPTYNDAIKLIQFDLKKAAKLLTEAGWVSDPDDGWRYKTIDVAGQPVRTKFSFTLNLPNSSSSAPGLASIIQEDLRKIGVEMKTRLLEWATFLELARKHEFQATFASWGAPVDPDYQWNLWHSESYKKGRNYVGYASQRVDELLKLGRYCFDDRQRSAYYAEASRIIYDDAPYAFLVNAPVLWGFHRRLRGVTYSPRGPFMFEPGIRAWWVPKGEAIHADVPN